MESEDNRDYIENMKQRAYDLTFDHEQYMKSLHYSSLTPFSPKNYYDSLMDYSRMKPFRPSPRKYAERDAGISFPLKFKAFFSVKDSKKELEEKQKNAESIYKKNMAQELESYERRERDFYETQEQHNEYVKQLSEKMLEKDSEQIEGYVRFVLEKDRFSVDLHNDYAVLIDDISYCSETGKLSYRYRIPNSMEVMTIKEYKYDNERDDIIIIPADKKMAALQLKDVIQKVLLRSVIMVFESDKYGFIDSIEVIGFIDYFEDKKIT